eukprot:jgi/Mesen1/6592/ME000338S05768
MLGKAGTAATASFTMTQEVRQLVVALVTFALRWLPLAERMFMFFSIPPTVIMMFISTIAASCIGEPKHQNGQWRPPSNKKQLQSSGAICRALSQVLQLINELPAASAKYMFARCLAEQMLDANIRDSSDLLAINRVTLQEAFARTIHQLQGSLRSDSVRLGSLMTGSKGTGSQVETAEKYARELLWLAEKMRESSCLSDAAAQWSKAGYAGLPIYVLNSVPRIQQTLIRLTTVLVNAIDRNKELVEDEVLFDMLSTWMPLLCKVTTSLDGSALTTAERKESEAGLRGTILSLPPADQELMLSIWLQEYSWSSSDWPNLHQAYEEFCGKARMSAAQAAMYIGK